MPTLVVVLVFAATTNYPQAVSNVHIFLHHAACFAHTGHKCKPTRKQEEYTGLE